MLMMVACKHQGSTGSTGSTGDVLLPDVAQATFVDGVDNPLLPWAPGASFTFDTTDGHEHIVVTVLPDPEEIEGVAAVAVQDTSYVDGVLGEDTTDWYAQDADGNVWYLGEDTCEYDADQCVDRHGSWKWGEAGALPGIVMWGDPSAASGPYYQEYLKGEAQDVAEVEATDASVEVPAGSFDGCVKTHETTPLEPAVSEHKTYCPGVGLVLTEDGGAVEQLTAR
jgi:hypothetical protein